MRIGFAALAGVVAFSTAAMAADQTIRSNELRASKIIGSTVYDNNNEKIGSVQDIMLGTGGRSISLLSTSAHFSVWGARTSPSICRKLKPIMIA